MTDERDMALGGVRPIDGSGETRAYEMPCDHLLTHGVVVGMTGSGKTGLLIRVVVALSCGQRISSRFVGRLTEANGKLCGRQRSIGSG